MISPDEPNEDSMKCHSLSTNIERLASVIFVDVDVYTHVYKCKCTCL